ncbi:heat shock protein Hsp20 [Roseivivax halodurans JCM 10272]|uniref:Heat shock protein Hsp20 n=1 Tax=Roseivivax halodurans JCM 10272 TaxID=1449350 RepID=X7EL49_9RHOB|nr:Hsp20/alpha crystallin family protein [Roseivivax halodurans]ETX15868.1 heat shock protein Hsp20 [Roseivivax halodurans JCM 10272]
MTGSKRRGPGNDFREEIDLRLDGLLGELGRTLGDMIDRLDGGSGEVRRSRSFDTGRGPVRAEAGIRIRAAGSDLPTERHKPAARARRPDTPQPSSPPAVRAIDAAIQHSAGLWTLTADLPGVSADDLSLSERDGQLFIAATTRRRTYEGRFELPPGVRLSDIEVSLRNGILDLTARPPEPEAP